MSGPLFEVFARTLRGLAACKVTRPGSFRNAAGDGHAVRCSYKVGWNGCGRRRERTRHSARSLSLQGW
jgi:hypothetical protein